MARDERPMNMTHASRPPVTALDQQTKRLRAEVGRLVNAVLNCMFLLTPGGSRLRSGVLIGLFVFTVALFGFLRRDTAVWASHLQNMLLYLFNPADAQSFNTNPIREFLVELLDAYRTSKALYYLLIIFLPFLTAWRLAAAYLADIFELKQVKIAENFIFQVALWRGKEKIRVREGEIHPDSEDLPAYLIGGPGLVIVELDSAALFERPDGHPHIIGPTIGGPVALDGFERFRQAIDLRDHRTDTLNITSRSLDGIPVQAVDVNFLFSVLRGNHQAPSVERPFPFFNNTVIESLVYRQAARVTPNGPRPAELSKSWAGTMTALIRSTLGEFMSQRDLTEYLASFGIPEVMAARQQTDTVIQSASRILPPEGPLPVLPTEDRPPDFIPRPDIRPLLFGEFAQEFPNLASQRGVELHWVGIGSWRTPNQIIPEQHLEAWQLSMDNQARRDSGTPNLGAQHIIRFIQEVPLDRFAESQREQRTHQETMFGLLVGYREQFMQILHIMEKKHERINSRIINRILRSLEHINQILGLSNDFPAHWVSPNPFETNSNGETTESTESSYNMLVQLVGGDQATADRLIEHERTQFPNASRQELIERAIERLLRDRR